MTLVRGPASLAQFTHDRAKRAHVIVIGLLSLLAGMLTALAPCVLPLLPVIVGGSLAGGRSRPYLITGSLIVSLLAFTWLLKATQLAAHIEPRIWAIGSGLLIIVLGLLMLFPSVWDRAMAATGADRGAETLLRAARRRRGSTAAAIATGAALGPVFSSCSPTYAWVIATVLPARPAEALLYLSLYCAGLAGALLAVALLGRAAVGLKRLANPRGWLRRGIAVAFIAVGAFIASGMVTRVQVWAAKLPSATGIEEAFLEEIAQGAAGPEHSQGIPAPEIVGIDHWINSDPLTLEGLRGKVVLIDFWTYSCINCIRTQPYLNAWYEAYHDDGLEIIGVHAPEFSFEKLPENVERAVREAEIDYPVALDNRFATWRAFHNRYWPAKYLIDREGHIRHTHFGEGNYEEMEEAIRLLLQTEGPMADLPENPEFAGTVQSPETYLGTERARGFVGGVLEDGEKDYTAARDIPADGWTLSGRWSIDGESITAREDGASLTYRFTASKVFLVMGGPIGASVHIAVEMEDGMAEHDIIIDSHRLYRLVELEQITVDTPITLTFDKGVTAHAFTFG